MAAHNLTGFVLIAACVLLGFTAFAARPFEPHIPNVFSNTGSHDIIRPSGKPRAELEEENRSLRIMLEEAQEQVIHLKSEVRASEGRGRGTGQVAPLSSACPKPIPTMKNRGELPDILEREGKTSGVELGVQGGYFSKWVLDRWPSCREYHLVDLWKSQENYVDLANCNQDCQNWYFNEAHKSTSQWADKVHFYRNYTTDAAKYFLPESVDYVYVDARHDYKGVHADLAAWWPILKPGGIFAGHDYVDADEVKYRKGPGGGQDWSINGDGTSSGRKAVRAAVDEFAASVGRQVVVTYSDPVMDFFWNSWAMRK